MTQERILTVGADVGDLIDRYVAERLSPQIEIVLNRHDLRTVPFAMNELPYLREPKKRDWEQRQKSRPKRRKHA